jgi:transketolase N-terminal domain/subunit
MVGTRTPSVPAMTTPSRMTAPQVKTSVSGREVRRLILSQSKRANVGHIGSGLSVADILAVLFSGILKGEPGDRDRDRLVMCKGTRRPRAVRRSPPGGPAQRG